jgi:protein gp37
MQERDAKIHRSHYPEGPYRVHIHQGHLTSPEPLKWKDPRKIFVNDLSDTFHEDVPFSITERALQVFERGNWHQWVLLTKRIERASEFFKTHSAPPNVWLGISIGVREAKARIDILRTIPVSVRYLSIEPLLEDLGEVNLAGIDWVICGGESCAKAQLTMSHISRAIGAPRPMKAEWARGIRDVCLREKVPFFFKQMGGMRKTDDRAYGGVRLMGKRSEFPSPKR